MGKTKRVRLNKALEEYIEENLTSNKKLHKHDNSHIIKCAYRHLQHVWLKEDPTKRSPTGQQPDIFQLVRASLHATKKFT